MDTYKISDKELLHELKLRFNANKKALNDLQVLHDELKTTNKKLEESEALKGHFIANITNEIRNPFTSILGLAHRILSTDKKDWHTVIPVINHIYYEIFYLAYQFKNIFIAADIEAGHISFENCGVDIQNLLYKLVDSFKFEAKKKALLIHIEGKVDSAERIYFNTDPQKLTVILSNLLSNAIKYSNNSGTIDIEYNITGNILKVLVQDYGEGISVEDQKIIFDRFKRANSDINSLNRGHGLGLSVTKDLLEILNGRIEVETQINKGTTFTVIIPESYNEIAGIAGDDNTLIFHENDEGEIF